MTPEIKPPPVGEGRTPRELTAVERTCVAFAVAAARDAAARQSRRLTDVQLVEVGVAELRRISPELLPSAPGEDAREVPGAVDVITRLVAEREQVEPRDRLTPRMFARRVLDELADADPPAPDGGQTADARAALIEEVCVDMSVFGWNEGFQRDLRGVLRKRLSAPADAREAVLTALTEDDRVRNAAAQASYSPDGELRIEDCPCPEIHEAEALAILSAAVAEVRKLPIALPPPAPGETEAREGARDLPTTVDEDVVRALVWTRLGSSRAGRHPGDEAIRRAEALGLLSHHGIWHATPQGEGALVALGLLDGAPAPRPKTVHALWVVEDPVGHYQPQLVSAYEDGLVDAASELYDEWRAEDEQRFRDHAGDGPWRFFTTEHELPIPTPAPSTQEDDGER